MSGAQAEGSAVAEGRLSEGSRSSHTSPRTPEGPSETRMRRNPIFSIGQVVQKSRPVSSCTFSSRVSAASLSVSRASVLSVMGPFLWGWSDGGGKGSGDGAGLLVLLALDLQEASPLGAALLLLDGVGHRGGEEEPLGVGVLRPAGHLVAVAPLDDLAAVHDRDAVRE